MNNSKETSEKFKKILKSNGIYDCVSEVCVEDAGLRGEGFASVTKLVTIKFEDSEKKPLNLFVKVQTENPSYLEMFDEMKTFEKEARFLTEYLEEAHKICKLKGFPGFIDFYPKCYHADQNMIVLENLVLDKKFTIKDKEVGQNLEDAKFAVKTLAKHHALAHAMIMENGGPENFFKKFPNLDHETYDLPVIMARMESALKNNINSTVSILEKNDVAGAKESAEKLQNLSEGKAMEDFMDSLKITEEDKESGLLVLGHGDYWNNNMMALRDQETNKIIHHITIDFQMTRYNTPALDLGYYFFTSVQPHVRQTHLLELLTLYKDTLNKVTEKFGYPTNFTIDQIFRDYRKKLGYGFWLGYIMTIGPGMALFKDVDMSKIDAKQWPVLMEQLINKWIDENPEKGKETAEQLVKLVEEYEGLKIN